MALFDVKITLEAPMHLGTAEQRTGTPETQSVPLLRDFRGHPCIPATALKGLHRIATEQAAAGLGFTICESSETRHMCQPLAKQPFCVICQIFGSPWLPSRIYYRDLPATGTPINEIRVYAPQSRLRGVQKGRYYAVLEALPAGTVFTGQFDHMIQDPALLALALIGLRSITAVGAGRSTGRGLCRVEAKTLDAAKRPVNEGELAAALRQLRGKP